MIQSFPISKPIFTPAKWMVLMSVVLNLACEDVIQVETPTEAPRLNVQALFRVDVNEIYLPVEVKVSETNPFFGEIPVTALENIIIIYEEFNDDNVVVSTGFSSLTELEPGTGAYFPNPNFTTEQRIQTSVIEKNILFSLIMNHKGRKYIAQTRYVPAVPIDTIIQGDGQLFSDNETEIIMYFTDDPDRDNFYIFDFDFNQYLVTEDKFYKGQKFQFSYFYDQRFEPGREINISILGADKTFYNYMDQLIEQSGDFQGPFQTPVATVRGNVFDITDLDNNNVYDNVDQPQSYPLGYFAIVQEIKGKIKIE